MDTRNLRIILRVGAYLRYQSLDYGEASNFLYSKLESNISFTIYWVLRAMGPGESKKPGGNES
jgi:hypothetical protein